MKKKHLHSVYKNKPLKKREIQVLKLICKELTSEQIGKKLKLSTRTVEGLRNKLFIKTKSKNSVGLVIYALKNKIISLK